MRILSIRLKNINSIYGDWTIDLRHPDYRHYGIFAITGPTGAGKTTLLDAICLALYGRTPRVDVSAGGNEVMSRQSGECSSEVGFEVNGKVYRVAWHQHRAGKKPDGNLQNIKRELAWCEDHNPLSTGTIIETGATVVLERIVELTGMKFEQFLRSMLLAQGGFAAFLQSMPKERSELLEQLSGTTVYSGISRWVHFKESDEAKALKALEVETGGIRLMTPDELEALRQEIMECDAGAKAIGEALNREVASLQWMDAIDALEKELVDLRERRRLLDLAASDINLLRDRCARADRAAQADTPYALWQKVKIQHDEALSEKAKVESTIPFAESSSGDLRKELDRANGLLSTALESQALLAQVLVEVRRLDLSVENAREASLMAQNESGKAAAYVQKLESELRAREKQLDELARQKNETFRYLEANRSDADLTESFSGIAELSRQWMGLRNDLERDNAIVARAEKSKDAAEIAALDWSLRRAEAENALENARDSRIKGEGELNALLGSGGIDDLEAARDALSLDAQGNLGASVAVLRNQLVEGAPCPVCGSTHHGSADTLPSLDQVEAHQRELREKMDLLQQRISAARKLRSALQGLEKAERDANAHFQSVVVGVGRADASLEGTVKMVGEAKERRDGVLQRLGEVEQRLRSILEPYQVKMESGLDESVFRMLESRKNEWMSCQNRFRTLESSEALCLKDIKGRQDALAEARITVEEKLAVHKAAGEVLNALSAKRIDLFGNRDPDREERQAETEVSRLRKHLEAKKQAYDDSVRDLGLLVQRRADLGQSIARLESECSEHRTDWLSRIQAAGFCEESEWMQARIDPDDRRAMVAKITDFDRRAMEYASAAERARRKLDEEKSRELTRNSREQVVAAIAEAKRIQHERLESLGAKREQLRADNEARDRHGLLLERTESRRVEWMRWKELDDLIGSAEGHKFRNIAQAITFEILVRKADEQLRSMNQRYRLRRNSVRELDLEVVDTFQADEVRPIANLSGGETFLVSLALALAMSAISGGQSQMDSLFLDEGFGTLDEESLEQVLSALASLHRTSKMIGVISHVEALKEQLPLRISVLPVGGGRSKLEGPGVSATISRDPD